MNFHDALNQPSDLHREGVIKFQCQHQSVPFDLTAGELAEFNSWRMLMFKLGLIGRDDLSYDGLAYGNISRRRTPGQAEFIISGTQTSAMELLTNADLSLVISAELESNALTAQGCAKPSSEALTHASIYQHAASVQAVIHVHSPEIWQHSSLLKLAHTSVDIPYGTPAMAKAVAEVLKLPGYEDAGIFSMGGHLDGIIAYGKTFETAANLIIETWLKAIQVQLLEK